MHTPEGPRIKFVAKADGSMSVEPEGFGGQLCRKATDPYLQRLGGATQDQDTAEAEMDPQISLNDSQEQRLNHG